LRQAARLAVAAATISSPTHVAQKAIGDPTAIDAMGEARLHPESRHTCLHGTTRLHDTDVQY